MATNYSELTAEIGDWLNRSDLTSVIPTFISFAEVGLERVLRVRQMIARANATVDTQYGTVPADFLEVRTFKLTSTSPVQPLQFATIDELDSLDATSTASGRPRHFGIVGNQIRVHPIPDGSYTGELAYFSKIPRLSDSNTTSWLLTSSPDAYLYGALLQAAPYLKDDERLNVWSTLYASAVQGMQTSDDRSATSGGALKARATPFGAR
jgi:hypothetical protein